MASLWLPRSFLVEAMLRTIFIGHNEIYGGSVSNLSFCEDCFEESV